MKNLIKVLAVVALVASMNRADAWGLPDKAQCSEWSNKIVGGVNSMHPYAHYFPGTWPFDEQKTVKKLGNSVFKIGKKLKFNLPGTFELPQSWLETNGGKKIRSEVQLGFAVLCKWLPAVLIVRSLFKTATRRKKHHSREDR